MPFSATFSLPYFLHVVRRGVSLKPKLESLNSANGRLSLQRRRSIFEFKDGMISVFHREDVDRSIAHVYRTRVQCTEEDGLRVCD